MHLDDVVVTGESHPQADERQAARRCGARGAPTTQLNEWINEEVLGSTERLVPLAFECQGGECAIGELTRVVVLKGPVIAALPRDAAKS